MLVLLIVVLSSLRVLSSDSQVALGVVNVHVYRVWKDSYVHCVQYMIHGERIACVLVLRPVL